MFKLYEVDPDADTLLIVPVSTDRDDTLTDGPHRAKGTTPELRIKVSSKHLSLASRYFANKFRQGSVNAAAVQADGRHHILLPGVDHVAATIVMNIIHARGLKVPRIVDLKTLANIAVFVDRYRFYDAVEVYADRWLDQLEQAADHHLPDTCDRELMMWLFVTYVFRRPALFKRATAVAVTGTGPGPISKYGLPIRDKIIKSINDQRQELASQTAEIVHRALDSSHGPVCSIGCDPFLQSAFATSLAKAGVSWPAAGSAGLDLAHFSTVLDAAREVDETHAKWHTNVGPLFAAPSYSSKPRKRKSPNSIPEGAGLPGTAAQVDCVDRLRLTPALQAVGSQVEGLDLESSLGYSLY